MADEAELDTHPSARRTPAAVAAEPEPAEPEPAGAAGGVPSARPARTSERWAFLELFAMCGFVVVQPVLEVLGGSPDFFIFHGVTAAEVVALVAIFILVPPVVLWGIGALSGLAGPRVRRIVHVVSIGLLFTLFAIQLGKHVTAIRGLLLVALAVLAAALMVLGYVRFSAAAHLLRFAAVGPLVFALLFTFASPSSAVVFPGDRPGAGGEPAVIGAHPPIVMIVLDELALLSLLDGQGQVDAERFPNFARLAGDSTWWRNATTVAGWTPYALPAMLTGRMPAEHVAPHHAVYPDNLFTLLGESYRIEASESITALCPPWYCGDRVEAARGGLPVALSESTGLLRELVSPVEAVRDPYDDFAEPTVAERIGEGAAARNDRPEFLFQEALRASQPVRFHEFMAALAEPNAGADPGDDRPTLNFLHLLLPHTPWIYLPDGVRYENVRGLPVDGEWWGRLALQRHLLQLEYTDQLLGETLRLLDQTGRYDESLIVLTADHGVALTPGPRDDPWIAGDRQLGPDNFGAEELAWVPLFIKEPGQTEGVVDERNWQHIDLLPTLADHAGVAVPWSVDGISWQRTERTGTGKPFFNSPDETRALDGPAHYGRIMADPDAIPPVPPAPLPELVGTPVEAHPVQAAGLGREVENADAFTEVDPDGGIVPALVHGTVSSSVREGTPLAIAVNGEIAAVVPVVAGPGGERRFAGLVEDVSLFVPGENQLELFLVPDGVTLHRLR